MSMILKALIKTVPLLLAISMFVPWPLTYAITDESPAQDSVQIRAADSPSTPCWTAFGKAIGGVNQPVDLFYIDTTQSAADIVMNLYLSNAHELSHMYRYLILEVGVYRRSSSSHWEKIHLENTAPDSAMYITLQNGQTSFPLKGYAEYKVAIDGGSFYCITANPEKGNVSPQFYMAVN